MVLASFGQGSNSIKSAEQGAGLGLPIAKSLIDLHGGTFTLKSKLRIGTEVVVTFPPERVVAAMAPMTEMQAPPIAAGRADPHARGEAAARAPAAVPGRHLSAQPCEPCDKSAIAFPLAALMVEPDSQPRRAHDRKPLHQNLHAGRGRPAAASAAGARSTRSRAGARMSAAERARIMAELPARLAGRPRAQARDDAVSRRLTWSLVLGVALSLAVLIATSGDRDAIAKLLRHDIGGLVLKLALVVFAGGLVLVMFRERLTKALEAMLFWAMVGLLLVVGYTYRFELRDAGDRVIAELMPGHVAGHGRNVEVVRGRGGDFALAAHINGARVPMVLDTGASSVVLTQEAAKAAGLPIEVLDYSVKVDTANGRTSAAPITLDRLAVGGLTERARAGAGRQVGAAQEQPARHELPQPAGKLGSARRSAADARHALTFYQMRMISSENRFPLFGIMRWAR